MAENTIVQFNWRRHWKKRVAPYLHEERVQAALDAGMSIVDPTWKRGDAPCDSGGVTGERVVKGKLSWYQPVGRCHGITPFSLVIGHINYPELSWKPFGGMRHMIAVGYGPDGKPRVVMDILNFDWFTAEQSMELADPAISDEACWAKMATLIAH